MQFSDLPVEVQNKFLPWGNDKDDCFVQGYLAALNVVNPVEQQEQDMGKHIPMIRFACSNSLILGD